jgi:hypothetical protein
LRSVKNIFPRKYLRTLYFSLFHCHLIYALEVWSCVSPALLQPLIKKQKAAIRIVGGGRYNDHTEPIFKSLSILPLTDLITLSNLKFFHSYIYKYIPKAFLGTWPTNRDYRDIDDRELCNDDYHIPRLRTDNIARFLFFNLPQVWNEISVILTSTSHKKVFATSASKDLLDKLSPTPNCNRLLCPACLVNNINNS